MHLNENEEGIAVILAYCKHCRARTQKVAAAVEDPLCHTRKQQVAAAAAVEDPLCHNRTQTVAAAVDDRVEDPLCHTSKQQVAAAAVEDPLCHTRKQQVVAAVEAAVDDSLCHARVRHRAHRHDQIPVLPGAVHARGVEREGLPVHATACVTMGTIANTRHSYPLGYHVHHCHAG